jgi:hypothetical protein
MILVTKLLDDPGLTRDLRKHAANVLTVSGEWTACRQRAPFSGVRTTALLPCRDYNPSRFEQF